MSGVHGLARVVGEVTGVHGLARVVGEVSGVLSLQPGVTGRSGGRVS